MKYLGQLKDKAKALKTEVIAIYLSMSDNRTPFIAKIMIVLTVSYAFSPIDLIPDFIPILGYLDDLIILPIMIAASIKLIPKEVLVECRIKAKEDIQVNKKLGIYSTIIIVIMWIGVIVFILSKLISKQNNYVKKTIVERKLIRKISVVCAFARLRTEIAF